MPRTCTVCTHPQRAEIETCLVDVVPFRIIASRFGTSTTALQRHKAEHLPSHVAQAKQAEEVANADDLLAQIKALRNKAISILQKAETAGDYRTALAGIKEARSCVEVLLEIEGKLDRRPTFNVTMSPQWVEIRTVILGSLREYPEAATAVAAALIQAEGRSSHAAD